MNDENLYKTVTVTEETSLLDVVLVNAVVFVVFFVIGYAIGQHLFKPKVNPLQAEVDDLIDQTLKGGADAKV
jgi:hypothetical protein